MKSVIKQTVQSHGITSKFNNRSLSLHPIQQHDDAYGTIDYEDKDGQLL